ncbi:integrase [Actinokineospora sp. UTMC 2448]|uniref:tyrosine-type recombinase/integrase n=1 Tax=Actinokineospora sp. UTMC 2448 TaxID=2268449 RepID=UPI002164A8EE|nr:integrase [Actinokineospora sp. UTMC 2448]UVS80622.1 Site-specific recombinase XerD [Actinokineospora sp. UTMC 2448]
MSTSFDVKIYSIEKREGKRKSTYRLVWTVGGNRYRHSFDTVALADSFRSGLVSATSKGEAFSMEDGLPVSQRRAKKAMSWYDFIVHYADMKWDRAAAKSRAGTADALATATLAMLTSGDGPFDTPTIRKALIGWALNKKNRVEPPSDEVHSTIRWLSANTLAASHLEELPILRKLMDQLSKKIDGSQTAAKTFMRKRAVIYNLLEYGVELGVIGANRLGELKWKLPRTVRAIDKRVVAINPEQGARLLAAVGDQKVDGQPRRSSGPMLKAYFACMYYAALRPEEAAMLRRSDLLLPSSGHGWGELLLSDTAPIAGARWTDSGTRRDHRHLKQRAKGEVRPVPCAPPLTAILQDHLTRFGVAADGRLFRNLTGGELAESTVGRVWDKARKAALTAEEYRSALARRPYDLRHACVSTWLAAGVSSAQCAAWAGHSVQVLHEIYAKVIAGLEGIALDRIATALGLDHTDEAQNSGTNREQTPGDDRGQPLTAGQH